eukprot:4197455-Karenia_brevis.AAC.1
MVFWYEKKNDAKFDNQHKQRSCAISARCEDCKKEVARRSRLLNSDTDATGAAQKLADPAFKN